MEMGGGEMDGESGSGESYEAEWIIINKLLDMLKIQCSAAVPSRMDPSRRYGDSHPLQGVGPI